MGNLLGIDRSEMMAAGDSPNDMAMMKAAGVAVAVGNAKPEVKAIADFIAPDHDQDGQQDLVVISADPGQQHRQQAHRGQRDQEQDSPADMLILPGPDVCHRQDQQRQRQEIVNPDARRADGRYLQQVNLGQEKAGKQAALYEKNVNASIPLEKERYTVSYIHNSVLEALNEYFESLGAQKRLSVIESLIKRSLSILGDDAVKARVVGIPLSDAEAMLKAIFKDRLTSCTSGELTLLSDEAVNGFACREGILLVSERGVTCRMTLDQKVREVLDSHSEELAAALFDGRISE
jgi:hypothetical protein